MIGADEYSQATAQPVDHEYAIGTSSDTNPNETTLMEYNMDGDADADGDIDGDGDEGAGTGGGISGGPWISPYDESCDEEDEEEPIEWTSPPPSPYAPQSFGISGDDEIFEEGNINDIVHGVDNIDVEQPNGGQNNDYEVHYIGLYKFVYLMSKTKSGEPSDNAVQEPSSNDNTTPAP